MHKKSKQILKAYATLYKKNSGSVTWYNLVEKTKIPETSIRRLYSRMGQIEDLARKEFSAYFDGIQKTNSYAKNNKKLEAKIIKDYALLYKKQGYVIFEQLEGKGYCPRTVRDHFSLNDLDIVARKTYPKYFKDVRIDAIFNPEKNKDIKQEINDTKIFIVTTAVLGCDADLNAVESVRSYCRRRNGKLLIQMSADPASMRSDTIDKALQNDHLIYSEVALNSNLFLSTIKLSAKQINPITGLSRIGQRNGSFIFASPKQFLQCVPVSNSTLPHALMTTGAITKPFYKPRVRSVNSRNIENNHHYMSERTAYIANNDHVMGAIIVEIEDDKIFHFRQIQFDKNGKFIDLGIEYSPDGSVRNVPANIVLGDWHCGSTDITARKASEEQIDVLKPKRIFGHDWEDFISINHHEHGRTIIKAKRASVGQLSLENELNLIAKDMDYFAGKTDQFISVWSNHKDFLMKYLNSGFYVKDPENHLLALKLAIKAIEGEDPVRWYIENVAKVKNKKKIKWLQRDDDFKIAGIQLGAHGDQGPNGVRGGLHTLENAFGDCMVGHSHTPGIIRGAWQVGTNSNLRLGYNEGPSSWLHCNGVVYDNGMRQLLISIAGSWRLKDEKQKIK